MHERYVFFSIVWQPLLRAAPCLPAVSVLARGVDNAWIQKPFGAREFYLCLMGAV